METGFAGHVERVGAEWGAGPTTLGFGPEFKNAEKVLAQGRPYSKAAPIGAGVVTCIRRRRGRCRPLPCGWTLRHDRPGRGWRASRRTAPAAAKAFIRALVFADFAGFSSLSDAQVRCSSTGDDRLLAPRSKKFQPNLSGNTWGDNLYWSSTMFPPPPDAP